MMQLKTLLQLELTRLDQENARLQAPNSMLYGILKKWVLKTLPPNWRNSKQRELVCWNWKQERNQIAISFTASVVFHSSLKKLRNQCSARIWRKVICILFKVPNASNLLILVPLILKASNSGLCPTAVYKIATQRREQRAPSPLKVHAVLQQKVSGKLSPPLLAQMFLHTPPKTLVWPKLFQSNKFSINCSHSLELSWSFSDSFFASSVPDSSPTWYLHWSGSSLPCSSGLSPTTSSHQTLAALVFSLEL